MSRRQQATRFKVIYKITVNLENHYQVTYGLYSGIT